MILEIEKWHLGYKQILHEIRCSPSSTILLLSGMDTDAICSARILTYLFRSDDVSYQLRPCTSYPTLVSILSEQLTPTVVAVVLLNVGITRNLTNLIPTDRKVTLYVMDCHRPFHLANAHAGSEVVLFLDEGLGEDVPSDGDGLSGGEESESDEESDSDGDEGEVEWRDEEEKGDGDDEGEEEWNDGGEAKENEEEKDGDMSLRKDEESEVEKDDKDLETQEVLETDDENDNNNRESEKRSLSDAENDDDDNETIMQSKRQRTTSPQRDSQEPQIQQSQISVRDRDRSRRHRIQMYYSSGTYHTAPSSWISYQLSTQLRHSAASDLLWLSCIGLTSSYLHSHISSVGYNHLARNLRSHVTRIYPRTREPERRYALSDDTLVPSSENGLILSEVEFPFLLLRQTSLYDAMRLCDTVALKLRVWTRDGVAHLREWLAQMGFPLDECTQPFAFMNPSLRKRLKVSMERTAVEYGFEKDDLRFDGFVRVTGFQSLIAASDVAHAVSALLEVGGVTTERAFNTAYDALNAQQDLKSFVNGCKVPTMLQRGISSALGLQKKIMATAVGLWEKNAVTSLYHFRYAFLHHGGEDAGDGTFCRALALAKLAKFISGMPCRKRLPLVLLAEKPNKEYLIVGYAVSRDEDEDVTKNKFEGYFELAARTMVNSVVKFETFLGNAVEVEGGSVQRFIEQLHYVMDAV